MSRVMSMPSLDTGPFRADQIRQGDRYELSHGHPVYCAPTGGQGASSNASGVLALLTDPDALSGGVDAGFSPEDTMLRAPDLAVGNVPEQAPGWVVGVPPLAVEYADRGQDEAQLQAKITELLAHGTRYVWVVRLVGPRRVEVYEPGVAMRKALAGEHLNAPGVLRNPVPVQALYQREAALDVALQNLLQRKGYSSLDEVLQEGLQPLQHQCERKLGHVLSTAEKQTLVARLHQVGPERLGDVLLDMGSIALAAWLADPNAR